MALLDDLKSALTSFRGHVAEWTNSGMLVTIDGHIDALAAAAERGVQAADKEAHRVLAELYTALHGSAPAEDVPVPAEPVVSEPAPVGEPSFPVESEPVPATGGYVSDDAAAPAAETEPETIVPADDTAAPTAG